MVEKDKLKEEFKKRMYGYIIRLIKFLNVLPKHSVINEIIKQLIRSGTSIGANYFEAQSASSRKDYQNYFRHSLKSANESKFWFNILLDSNLIPTDLLSECHYLLRETNEIANIFASSILTMKGRK
jgi:four helix bundle protein